jgi:tetratricopeptide (TPR) repeat protein
MGLFSKLLSRDPGERAYRAHAHANRLIDSGKAAEAEESFKKAYELYVQAENDGCNDSRILTGYAVLLMRMSKFEKAKELVAKVYADSSLSADDRYQICMDHALCQWKLGYVDKALSDMELCGDHHKTGLYYDIMCALHIEKAVETGDFSEAEKMCGLAMDYDDEDAHTLCNAGWLNHLLGDDAKAVEQLKKADSINPNYPASKVYLAEIARKSGDISAAGKYLDAALAVRFPTTSPVTRAYAEDMRKQLG